MESFSKKIEIRWSDLDPNFHVLHSRYYDFGAYCRMAFLTENGFTPAVMMKHHVGPILFREECLFKREVTFGDEITINFKLEAISADYRKWTMVHEIFKNKDTLSAFITAEGSWLNTVERKVTIPPQEVIDLLDKSPRTDSFRMT
jgi:acyl-CoA thioester hydrolase